MGEIHRNCNAIGKNATHRALSTHKNQEIMCLYPRLIKNRKYTVNKKNGGNVPPCDDQRLKLVPVGCGNCIECRKQKANQWKVRLNEELRKNKGYYVTLTFAPEELKKLMKKYNLKECNALAGKAVRMMTERFRKKHKKTIKHWLITELGDDYTERIHLHGILFDPCDIENIQDIWKYGHVDVGEYCNEKTINYIVKYVTKIDTLHKNYRAQIFSSQGMGSAYTKREQFTKHKYNGSKTKDFYILPNGQHIANPIYYRNKLYTEEEREKLWLQRLDQQKRYVRGIEIDVSTEKGWKNYLEVLKHAQEYNNNIGYGDDSNEWKKESYNITAAMLKHKEKLHNYAEIAYFDKITRKKAQKTQ